MVSTRNAPSIPSPPLQEANCTRAQLDLGLEGCRLDGASVDHSREGTIFACTIGPLSDETTAALERAAKNGERICLLFPQPLSLDLAAVERKGLQRVRILGRIVGSSFSVDDW